MSKIDNEDDLNDGLDDGEFLCGGYTDPRSSPYSRPPSSPYSRPYGYGPWNSSQSSTLD